MPPMTRVMEIAETQIARRLATSRIVALAAFEETDQAEAAGSALVRAGVPCIELSAPTLAVIRGARRVEGLLVGVGSVHTADDAETAVRGGAHFGSSPATNMEVVHACRELELPFFPGVATPSEIERLMVLGLRVLRVFPAASLGGPGFLQAVAAIYPDVRFIPSGGIGPESLRSYLNLSSVLAVCTSGMVRPDLLRSRSYDRIEWLAREAARAAQPRERGPR